MNLFQPANGPKYTLVLIHRVSKVQIDELGIYETRKGDIVAITHLRGGHTQDKRVGLYIEDNVILTNYDYWLENGEKVAISDHADEIVRKIGELTFSLYAKPNTNPELKVSEQEIEV